MENEYAIDVEKINKSFGEIHAVVDFDLKVKKGEIFGFLGPNGGGKTTTIRMLCGLLTPDSGKGHCLGFDIVNESYEIKKRSGYMTQRFSFYEDLTIYENLNFIARMYSLENKEEKINKIIKDFDFTGKQNQLAGTLSGGWKQRMALAACLLHSPQLLLLDEPTAGVDPKARREFWDIIHSLSKQGITTLVSTHYMDEAERCSRLGYMSFGKLLIYGTLHEVIDKVGLTTYEVRGPKLADLAHSLRTKPGLEQVVVFGEILHISGMNAQSIEKAVEEIKKNKEYQCKQVTSSLEDVFIKLVGEREETKK